MFSLIEAVEKFARETPAAYLPMDVPVGKAHFVRLCVKYDKGGVNTWSGVNERRGYRLHITFCEKESDGGYSYTPTAKTNLRLFIGNEVKRNSNKAFREAMADLRDRWLQGAALRERLAQMEALMLKESESAE